MTTTTTTTTTVVGLRKMAAILHVNRCEMLHFVTSYMKQNKSRKQTLESAQYGLEISFNSNPGLNVNQVITVSSIEMLFCVSVL